MKAFLDTNVLVYAQQSEFRGDIARDIVSVGGVISVQVLNEFANVLRKKFAQDWVTIGEALDDICDALGEPRALTIHTHRAAVHIARDHGLSFYDALIVAAALEAGCEVLLSEDMQNGRVFGGLTIRNPFKR